MSCTILRLDFTAAIACRAGTSVDGALGQVIEVLVQSSQLFLLQDFRAGQVNYFHRKTLGQVPGTPGRHKLRNPSRDQLDFRFEDESDYMHRHLVNLPFTLTCPKVQGEI
jgi:hypothetical protein